MSLSNPGNVVVLRQLNAKTLMLKQLNKIHAEKKLVYQD